MRLECITTPTPFATAEMQPVGLRWVWAPSSKAHSDSLHYCNSMRPYMKSPGKRLDATCCWHHVQDHASGHGTYCCSSAAARLTWMHRHTNVPTCTSTESQGDKKRTLKCYGYSPPHLLSSPIHCVALCCERRPSHPTATPHMSKNIVFIVAVHSSPVNCIFIFFPFVKFRYLEAQRRPQKNEEAQKTMCFCLDAKPSQTMTA